MHTHIILRVRNNMTTATIKGSLHSHELPTAST